MEEREDDYLKQIDALAKELAERGPVHGRFTATTKGMEDSMLKMQNDMEVVYKDVLVNVPEINEMAVTVLAMDENDPARKTMLDRLNMEVQIVLDEREHEKAVEQPGKEGQGVEQEDPEDGRDNLDEQDDGRDV